MAAESIARLLEENDDFHDMHVGYFELKDGELSISFEDLSSAPHPSESRVVGYLAFKGITDFGFSLDTVLGMWVSEVLEEAPGKILVETSAGTIWVEAESVELGTPAEPAPAQ